MDDEPRGVPAKLPSDYRAFRRPYRWPLLYGPWALGGIGLVMLGVGLFVDRPGQVALAAIGFGAAMVIAGVLLPRMQGPLELEPSGVKGAVEGLPEGLMLVAVTAKEAAEQAIPDTGTKNASASVRYGDRPFRSYGTGSRTALVQLGTAGPTSTVNKR